MYKRKPFAISSEQARCLSNIRRFKTDDATMIFDGTGNSYKAKITSINKSKNMVFCFLYIKSLTLP
jgi:16S rRNA U1498 N3-methylase RsmE